MRRKLWVKLTLMFGIAAAMLAIGGVWALDSAVDYTLKQMSGSELPEDANAVPEPSDEPSGTPVPPADSSGQGPSGHVVDRPPQPNQPNPKPDAAETPEKPPSAEAEEEPAKEEAEDLTYSSNVSPDKAEVVQEAVTTGEKAAVASVLLSSFSAAELRQFAEIARDGITVEEKKAAKDLFLDRLSEEEYDRLIQIAAKYGLSQGKSYEESLEEKR